MSVVVTDKQVLQYRDAQGLACEPEVATQVYIHNLVTGGTMRGTLAAGDDTDDTDDTGNMDRFIGEGLIDDEDEAEPTADKAVHHGK